MPQLYLAVALISLLLGKLKDIFATIKISDGVKTFIKWLLIGLLIYYVYKIITHHVNKQKALGDISGSLAIELNNALYSQATNFHVPLFGDFHLGNGDEAAVLAISLRIKDINQVSAFYKDLYERDLFVDLTKVLDTDELAQFNQNVQYNKNTGTTVTPNPTDATYPVYPSQNNGKAPLKGTAIYCKSKTLVNMRSAKDPTKVLYKVNADTTYVTVFGKGKGYLGDFVKETTAKINGKVYSCYEIDIPYEKQIGLVDINYGLNGLIVKDYVGTK